MDKVTAEIETKVKITVDIQLLAQWFAGVDDDTQAKFFVAVCEEAKNWGSVYQGQQWYAVGSHIRNCKCSSDLARNMIEELYNGLKTGNH